MLLVYNKLASAEDNGVVLHNPLALTHPFLPCRPAYLEAWRQITQYYLLPDRGDRPAFTPTGQVGTRFIDPVRMKG